MSIRFQKEDDVDREVKKERRTTLWSFLFQIVFFAVVIGVLDWLSGQALKSFWEELGGIFAIAYVCWLVIPVYEEFRIRTKEIDDKVSAIEAAVNETKERDTEMFERLTAIESKLEEIQDANRK